MAKPKTIRPIRRPAAVESWYRKKLQDFLLEMGKSYYYWLSAAYRRDESRIVQDASPQANLRKALASLDIDWDGKIDDFVASVAETFTRRLDNSTKSSLQTALRDSGVLVSINNTREVNMVYQATVRSNAALIRDLCTQYQQRANEIIWRGVQYGRDLGYIRTELNEQLGIETRRAARIAEDQANKATESLATARADAIGLTRAYWQHNAAGSKTYRSTHLDFDGQDFDVHKGLYDDDVGYAVVPGELPFCKCSKRFIIPGYND